MWNLKHNTNDHLEVEKKMKTIYVYLNHFAVCQKLTQHCKATICQYMSMSIKFIKIKTQN